MEKKKFFREVLEEGMKGPDVLLLQLLIVATRNRYSFKVIPDGDYTVGGRTGNYVADLQSRYGITQDRNFGPETRKAFLEETGIDKVSRGCRSYPFFYRVEVWPPSNARGLFYLHPSLLYIIIWESHEAFVFYMNEEKKNFNNGPWWKPAMQILSQVSTWIVVPIVLALVFGKMLDTYFGTKPVIFLVFAGIGFLVTCFGMYKVVKDYIKKLQDIEKDN